MVSTDISGVPSTSPTESQGICSHYVKRGLRTLRLGERPPSDLSTLIIQERMFNVKDDSGSHVTFIALPIMVVVHLGLFALIWYGKIPRVMGGLLMGTYIAYLIVVVLA